MKRIFSVILAITIMMSLFVSQSFSAENDYVTLSHNITSNILSGMKVAVNLTTNIHEAKYNYYQNGVLYESNSDRLISYPVACAGVNTICADAVDKEGNVIATSDPITFNAYPDILVTVLSQSVSTLNYPSHNGQTSENQIMEDDLVTFSEYEEYGDVLKIGSGVSEDGTQAKVNVLSLTRNPLYCHNSADRLIVQSIDVYPEMITGDGYLSIVSTVLNTDMQERILSFFTIEKDSICIANNLSSSEYTKIPYENSRWYTFTVVIDPVSKFYCLIVDDTIYSLIDAKETNYVPAFYPDNYIKTFLYFDIRLFGSGDADNPCVVYLDNYKVAYSHFPDRHSPYEYVNNAQNITQTNSISPDDNLTVSFVAVKGSEKSIICALTLLDKSNKLVSLSTKTVSFGENESFANVSLTLENLPTDIATGDYTIGVMIWDAKSLKPLVAKTNLSD